MVTDETHCWDPESQHYSLLPWRSRTGSRTSPDWELNLTALILQREDAELVLKAQLEYGRRGKTQTAVSL